MSEKPVREYDKFMLRLPEGMRDRIAERAKASGRSMNSEIVQILEDVLNSETPWNASVDGDMITMSTQQLNKISKDLTEALAKELTERFDLIPKSAKSG